METATKSNSLSDQNNNLCRVCLSANDENKYIFNCHVNLDHEIYSSTDLWEKLQFYGGIEVTQCDGLPAKMCTECISKMSIAHEFRKQCQETDKILRSIRTNTPNKNDLILQRVKEVVDQIESGSLQSDEIENLEELYSDESNIDAAVEMSDARIHKISENEISTCIENVEHVNEAVKKVATETDTIPSLKQINSGVQRPCQAQKESHTNLSIESTGSGSILENSRNYEPEDSKRAKEDKSVLKKEEYRSRRLILFKRATSMTNLKNNKERQRQYIKKTLFTKFESSDRDNVQNSKTTYTGVRQLPITSSLPHKCSKCGRSYSSKTALESHEISHGYKKFSCDQCTERFSRLNDFLEHAKTHDLDEKLKPASCKICNKNFRKTITMVRHLNVHKRENPRAVYYILKDMRDRRKEKNMKMSKEDKANENLENNIIFHGSQEASQLEKINSESQENRNCVQNRAGLTSEKDTKNFRKNHSSSQEEFKFSCNLCNTKFLVEDNLKMHRKHCRHYEDNLSGEQSPSDERSAIKLINIWIKEELDSDTEGKGFSCENCSKSYATKKSLLKHQEKLHANIVLEYCSRCGEHCICKDRIKENHKDVQEKVYTCEECNKTFEKQVKLEKHLRIHVRDKEQQDTNFKRFLCHICSKTFRQNTGLMFHMRTHTGYKPHVCKYCGRGFTSNSNCINHERTHTGDRPFVCHFCSAAFAKSCTLKAHITTHTGEANYHCKTCGKSFRRLKYLKEHRFTHTGEKPYACKICGTAYSHSGSLFVHEKKCKAQEGNYQTTSVSVSQNYRHQPLTTTTGVSTITPIIMSSPSSHHNITSMDNSLTVDATKHYIENIPRMNNSLVNHVNDSTGAHTHLSSDTVCEPSVVRSFTIVGQMFHT